MPPRRSPQSDAEQTETPTPASPNDVPVSVPNEAPVPFFDGLTRKDN